MKLEATFQNVSVTAQSLYGVPLRSFFLMKPSLFWSRMVKGCRGWACLSTEGTMAMLPSALLLAFWVAYRVWWHHHQIQLHSIRDVTVTHVTPGHVFIWRDRKHCQFVVETSSVVSVKMNKRGLGRVLSMAGITL